MSNHQFKPSVFLKNKHIQTIFGSKKKPILDALIRHETPLKLNLFTNEKVTLTGRYSQQPNNLSKGLVIMLHGWLGSVDSSYMLARGEAFFKDGYDVFRLNMRDHGDSLELNRGLFHACLLEEVYEAIKFVAALHVEKTVHLLGFSLGGSFALRVGWRNSQSQVPIPNLKNIIAICPSVEPAAVFQAIDGSKIYRAYFTYKLRKSLIHKQKIYPQLYNFSNILKHRNCTDITKELIEHYLNFENIDDYFLNYRFDEEKLNDINIPIHILASEDDPVIPIEDIIKLRGINPKLDIKTTKYGGHVGYINTLNGQSWLDTYLTDKLNNVT